MNKGKSSLKYTLIASLLSLAILGCATLVYDYLTRPIQPGKVTEVPPASDTKQVVAAGDIACSATTGHAPNSCQHAATASIAEQLKPDAVLLLGDLQYESGRLADYNNNFDPTWGKLKAITYPAPGNHEYETTGAAGYFDYFGDRAGDRSKGYYSFNLGDWHIIALNSNCSKIGGCDTGSPQGKWLADDLTKNTTVCTLAFWHHPAMSSGKYADSQPNLQLGRALWDQVAGKANVVLNGHDHLYERFAPANGTTQFTVGTGGRSHYAKTTLQPNSQKIIEDTYGVLHLNLKVSSYTWRFVGVSGETLDQGQSSCNK